MRTPRRLDLLAVAANQLPTSSILNSRQAAAKRGQH